MNGKEVLETISTWKNVKELEALLESYYENYHIRSFICILLQSIINAAKTNIDNDTQVFSDRLKLEHLTMLVVYDIEYWEKEKKALYEYLTTNFSEDEPVEIKPKKEMRFKLDKPIKKEEV